MSRVPDTPPTVADAEQALITLLYSDTTLQSWDVKVSRGNSKRGYDISTVDLVTVKELSGTRTPESVTNDLDRVEHSVEVRLFTDTPARKHQLHNQIDSILRDAETGAIIKAQGFQFMKAGSWTNLDSLSQADGILSDAITVTLTAFDIKTGGP